MATPDRILQLKLVSDVSSAQKGMKTMSKDMTRVQKAQGRMSAGFKSMGAAIGGLVAIDVGVNILKGGIEDFFAAEEAARNFGRVLEGLSTDVPGDMAKVERAMTDALSLNFDDTEFQTALTGLMSRMRIGVPRALRVMSIAMDLVAAGVFPDLESATKGVEKALRGKKKALEQLGLPTGKVMSDARLLEILEQRYGQAAEDNAATLPGRWKQIETQFGESVEGLVGDAFRLSDDFAVAMEPIGGADWLNSLLKVTDAAMAGTQAKLQEGAAGIVGEAAKIGLGIYAAITGETGRIPEAVGADVTMTEEQMNAINVALFHLRVKREVDAALAQTDRLVDETAIDIARLEAVWATWRAPGILGAIARGFHWPIPGLAEGGIVNRPTLAMIGEKGPEAVVPLTGSGSGLGSITVNVQTGVGDPVEIGRAVDRVLRAYRGRAGVAA